MKTEQDHDACDNPNPSTTESHAELSRKEREKSFSRRALLQWSLPLAAVGVAALVPSSAQAAHGDSPHGDTPHSDTPHGDVAHTDVPHADHPDHGDVHVDCSSHIDSHTDHNDVQSHCDNGTHSDHDDHGDTHADATHSDSHNDHKQINRPTYTRHRLLVVTVDSRVSGRIDCVCADSCHGKHRGCATNPAVYFSIIARPRWRGTHCCDRTANPPS